MSVPLPDVLGTCPCPDSDGHRRHATKCTVATDFARGFTDGSRTMNESAERPATGSEAYLAGWDRGHGMELNVRYAAITWVHPASFSVDGTFRGDFDPEAFFGERLEEYIGFEQESGHEPWEKPSSFIYHLIEEEQWTPFGGGGRTSRDDSSLDGDTRLRVDGHEWGPDDTRRLHQALGIENADGEPIEPTIDPKGRPVLPPAPAPVGMLPIGDIYSGTYRDHFDFGARYIIEAAAIRRQAVANGVDVAQFAGIDRETLETIVDEVQTLLGLG